LGAARKLHPVIKNTTVIASLVASRLQDPKGWVSEVEYMTQGILEGYLERQLILEDREATTNEAMSACVRVCVI
jgi:hypothetical protein